MKEASLLFCLPDNPFFLPKSPESHAVQEATYACKILLILPVSDSLQETSDCGWIFAQHFCNRLGPAYLQLKNVLDETDPAHAEVLNNIKRRFREETFTRESIAQAIQAHPLLVHPKYIYLVERNADVLIDPSALCQLCDDPLSSNCRSF